MPSMFYDIGAPFTEIGHVHDLDSGQTVPIGETIASDVGWGFSRRRLRTMARRARKIGRLAKKAHVAPFRVQYKVLKKYGPKLAKQAVKAASNPRTLYQGLKLVNAARQGNVGAMAKILKVRKLGRAALRQVSRTPPRARVPRRTARAQIAAASAYTALKAASTLHKADQAAILKRRAGITINPRTSLPSTAILRRGSRGVFGLYQRGFSPHS